MLARMRRPGADLKQTVSPRITGAAYAIRPAPDHSQTATYSVSRSSTSSIDLSSKALSSSRLEVVSMASRALSGTIPVKYLICI